MTGHGLQKNVLKLSSPFYLSNYTRITIHVLSTITKIPQKTFKYSCRRSNAKLLHTYLRILTCFSSSDTAGRLLTKLEMEMMAMF